MRKESSIKRNCFDSALKVMFKYENPTLDQIYKHMCLSNNCPEEHCSNEGGFRAGRGCSYVMAVKLIISKLKLIRDEN